MTDFIKYEVRDGIAHVTIDRPEKRNAMNYAMLADFYATMKQAGREEGTYAVVIEGTGGAFCAGTDLTDLGNADDAIAAQKAGIPEDGQVPFIIGACPRPVIAAVDGPAMGMGAEFGTQCDVRIASTNAKFGFVFVLRGLVSDTGAGSFLLPQIVGATEALRLLMSGEVIDAHRALELGLVTQVVAPQDLAAAAEEEAKRYANASPFAVGRTKQLVYGAMHNGLDVHLRETTRLLNECFRSEDHAEGVAAFLERRPAKFTGR